MTIDNYGYYEVQSVLGETNGSGFWHLPNASRARSLAITVYSKQDHEWFHFMFVEAGETSTFYIVSRDSGLPLRVDGMTDRVALTQDVYRPEHDAQYRFVLSPDQDDESAVTIETYPSGNRLLVDGASTKNKQGIFAYAALPEERRHHLFRLTKVGDAVAPATIEVADDAATRTRHLPRLERLDQEIDLRTEPVLLEEQIVPCFMVNDPGLAPYRQVEKSPYYRMARLLRWEKLRDRLLDGLTTRKSTETTTVGMTQVDAASVASTFSWSVEVSAEAGYSGAVFSASTSVTSKMAGEVARTRQHSAEHRTDRTFEEEITYPTCDSEYRIVTWAAADVYELRRADDEHPIHEWSTIREGEEATDLFVPKGERESGRPDRRRTRIASTS